MAIDNLIEFLVRDISHRDVLEELEQIYRSGTSTASPGEEGFTREILCPALREYFETQSSFTPDQITEGLGTEGSGNVDGFSFTPKSGKHLFTKNEAEKSQVPGFWFNAGEDKPKASYPDFAIRDPLPMRVIGEVKFVVNRSTEPLQALYDAAKQALFYLGVFANHYDDALIVIADGTKEHSFISGLEKLNPVVRSRFGPETSIHLCIIPLK